MNIFKIARRVARGYSALQSPMAGRPKYAGPLTDVSKLRYQAVFLMGPAGSGKSYLVDGKYMKYLPGAPPEGAKREQLSQFFEQDLDEQERGLTNLTFEKAVETMRSRGFEIELTEGGDAARIPFRIYTYDERGAESEIDPANYETVLPSDIYDEVKEIQNIVYKAPVHELPSYWRQVNPDLYKEELIGYRADQPGYVHEMSSEMSKGYFQAAIESGDPIVIDGTGTNVRKMTRQMSEAKAAGYKTSLVYVYVPLTISLLRNAARARKVDPYVVLSQWTVIKKNFPKLRGVADKAQLIDNTNPAFDKKVYAQRGDDVNRFMMQKTGMTLAEFVMENTGRDPKERKALQSIGAL
ncbi:MAG: zeta toxin family protein [Erythrobacter sp.]|nr:zeta toxin family protein [Erythrobacter sp.]